MTVDSWEIWLRLELRYQVLDFEKLFTTDERKILAIEREFYSILVSLS